MPSEQSIEQKYVHWVRQMYGGRAIKLDVKSQRGVPDRMVMLPRGVLFFIEFKAPGKTVGVYQRFLHKIWEEHLGQRVYVCDNLTDAQRITRREAWAGDEGIDD